MADRSEDPVAEGDADLLQIEARILGLLLAGDDPALAVLRRQFACARVARRERTDVGFFAHFYVPAASPRLAGSCEFLMDDVAADLVGTTLAARFVLAVRDGALDFLEGAVFGERWPAPAVIRRAYYLQGGTVGNAVVETSRRDLAAVRARFAD